MKGSDAALKSIQDMTRRFGDASAAARAPGRVNLIGDHVDYCGGVVMPFAIDRDCVATVHPGAADASTLVLSSVTGDDEVRVAWDDAFEPGRGTAIGSWGSYVLGVLAGLCALGSIDSLRGCRIAVATDVPLGAGLSSSAALEVSVGVAVAAHCGIAIDGLDLARLCQAAEHRFAGVPCGLMDQAISVLGRAGHLVMLDCATEATRHVPIPAGCELVVINSGVSHALADGAYAKRRAACERAAAALGVRHLAHAAGDSLAALHEDVLPFARHVVSETERVGLLASHLASADLEGCGRLMLESHASLRDDFRVSCPEIDAIVDAVRSADGVYGARMTGGGFGGCVVVLAMPCSAASIAASVEVCREQCPRLAMLSVRASDGARLLRLD